MELYYANRVEPGKLFLDEEESHHCIKVMRHKVGEILIVTDGNGKKYETTILKEDRRKTELSIDKILSEEQKNSLKLHVAIAPTKITDRFEWFIEKATEIGIDEITPLICVRSEKDKVKHERLSRILVSAMKQSLRLWLPELKNTISFKKFLEGISAEYPQKFIAHCQSNNLPELKTLIKSNTNTIILIGPEGDFTLEEITAARLAGFFEVSLGNKRLRTETAGLVAVNTFQLLNNQSNL